MLIVKLRSNNYLFNEWRRPIVLYTVVA